MTKREQGSTWAMEISSIDLLERRDIKLGITRKHKRYCRPWYEHPLESAESYSQIVNSLSTALERLQEIMMQRSKGYWIVTYFNTSLLAVIRGVSIRLSPWTSGKYIHS